jgi:hypothetical protein
VTPERGHDWRPIFLSVFRQTGIVSFACRGAGISRTQAYRERRRNTRFAADWEAAEEDATEALEAEARRRALATSDTLLMFLLKARRPDMYRDNVRIDLRREAAEIIKAAGSDMSVDEVLEEAERLARAALSHQTPGSGRP